MKTKLQFGMRAALVALVCGVLADGCCHLRSPSAYRPIHQLAINGDTAGVAGELAKNPGDLNRPEDAGQTPLHLAAIHCRTNVVSLLLDKGAKLEVRAKDGSTPLHLAAQAGCVNAVTLLLVKGAKVNPRDNQGRTPSGRAKQLNRLNPDVIVGLLKEHGGTE
jgi:ankyrin repeat protein